MLIKYTLFQVKMVSLEEFANFCESLRIKYGEGFVSP